MIVDDCDVAVVGAGPAGALAAGLLAREGADVVLIDRAAFPRFKVCGCCLNADALGALERSGLGSRIGALGGRPLRRMVADTPSGQATFDLPEGLALSRERLDEALVAGATAVGVRLFERTTACGLEPQPRSQHLWLRERARDTRRKLRAGLVVAADGLGGSFLRSVPGFEITTGRQARLGLATVIDTPDAGHEPGCIHMACGRFGYCGLVRLEGDRLAAAAAVERAFLRDCGSPGAAAARLLAEGGQAAPAGLEAAAWQGTPGLTRHATPTARQRVFVLGDAAGYVEPFTGEGMAWALTSAERFAALARPAFAAGRLPDPGQWSRAQGRLLGARHRRCRRVTAALRHPALVHGAVQLLQRAPGLGTRYAQRFGASLQTRAGCGAGLLH